MRSFNANFNTEKNKRADGPAPINLLKFNFATPVYLSDRDITPSGGPAHQGLIKKWGTIDSAVAPTAGTSISGKIELSDLSLTIINTESSPFSANFSADDPPENIIVELYQWFAGLAYTEKEILFRGYVADSIKYDLYECQISIKNLWQKYNKKVGEDLIITEEAYPHAWPEDIGKMENICYGELGKVPCRGLVVSVIDKLVEALTDVATSFEVSGSSMTDFPTGTVTVLIEDEEIQGTYSQTTKTFTSCTRGYNGTAAVAHTKGTEITEILEEYVYEIAAHPIKAANTVRIDGVKQTADYVIYKGVSGNELAGYEGKAVIKFTTEQHDEVIGTGTYESSSGDVGNPGNAIDNDDNTYASIARQDGGGCYGGSAIYRFQNADLGTIDHIIVRILYISSSYSNMHIRVNAEAYQTMPNKLSKGEEEFTFTGAWVNDVEIVSVCPFYLYEVMDVTVYYSVGLKNRVVKKQVTCDMTGYDDIDGSYTGTPSTLIQRPDHVFDHLWCERLGAPDSAIDSATFTAAGTFYAANDYKFALLVNEPIQADQLFTKLALQCRSRFLVTAYGSAKLHIRELDQSSVRSIPKAMIKRDSVKLSRSAISQLFNLFHIYFDKDHSMEEDKKEAYAKSQAFSSANSISHYGQRESREDEKIFFFDALTDALMVADVGAFILQYYSTIRKIPRFGVFLDNLEIEPGDIIDVTHDLDFMSGFKCEALKCLHHLGSRKAIDYQEVIAVEN